MLLTGAALVGGTLALGGVARRAQRPKASLAAILRPAAGDPRDTATPAIFPVAPRTIALGTLAVGGSTLLLTGANGYTPLVLAKHAAAMLQSNRYGPLLYIAADTIRPLTFFPDSLMTLISGLIFGPVTGFVVSYVGFGTSALVAYSVGRALRQREPIAIGQRTPEVNQAQAVNEEPMADVSGLRSLFTRYGAKMQEHPFTAMVFMHGMFLHADTVNCLAGYMGLAPRPFLAGAMIGVLPALTANVLAGASLYGSLAAGAIRFNPALLLASGLLLGGTFVITRYWFRT
ncbi:MAG: VTT domain-containing protein [Caldilineaceae bacterium]